MIKINLFLLLCMCMTGIRAQERHSGFTHEEKDTLNKELFRFENVWKNMFNSESLPWEKDMSLWITIWPGKDGNLDSLKVIAKHRGGNEEILSDENNLFFQEVKSCISLIRDWRVFYPWTMVLREYEADGKRENRFVLHDTEANRLQVDTLVYDGVEYSIMGYPLQYNQLFFTRLRERFKGKTFTRKNPRGYVARWKLDEEQLFLMEIRDSQTGEIIPKSVFDSENHGEPLLASWYTGELRIRAGAPVPNRYGVKNVFDKEMTLQLARGRVIGGVVYNNYVNWGDTVAQNSCDSVFEKAVREQFADLKNNNVSVTFTILPWPDGSIRNIEYHGIQVWKGYNTKMEIKDVDHPCMKVLQEAVKRVASWEVRFIRGEVIPVEWEVTVKL